MTPDDTTQPAGAGSGLLGKLIFLVVLIGCGFAAYHLLQNSGAMKTSTSPQATPATAPAKADSAVHIGVAFGTEKRLWLQDAVRQFATTPAGANVKVELIPLGSLDGAQHILRDDEEGHRINAWAPASSLYKQQFVQEWQDKFNSNPIAAEEQLALTPMVFVFWQERYTPFVARYGEVNFKSIAAALNEKGGWDGIAGHTTDWGYFKFGHTNPITSNSGVMSLVLMSYDYYDKQHGLTLGDITSAPFQTWSQSIEHAASDTVDSTGDLMKDMVLKGPSTYDALFVYESVAIDYLKKAEGRSGRLQVVYPRFNLWNDNPYYVLNVPWSSDDQKHATQAFLDFLMTEPMQRLALEHGFRPGNPSVGLRFDQSPFVQYASYGLRPDVPVVAENPPPEIIHNLQAGWQRSQSSH